MVNWILATIAATLWSTAYGWYFSPDIRYWLWRRKHRKQLAEIERAKAYAAWMRRTSPPARPPADPPPPASHPRLRPSGTVIAFPARSGRRP